MCIHVCVCVHVRMFLCTYINKTMCMCVYVYAYVYVYVCVCVCICVCVHKLCVLIITSARRLCYCRTHLFVCLFVSKIVQITTSG